MLKYHKVVLWKIRIEVHIPAAEIMSFSMMYCKQIFVYAIVFSTYLHNLFLKTMKSFDEIMP